MLLNRFRRTSDKERELQVKDTSLETNDYMYCAVAHYFKIQHSKRNSYTSCHWSKLENTFKRTITRKLNLVLVILTQKFKLKIIS
jgi:hypothetical protein